MRLVCILILAFQFIFYLRLVMSFFPLATGSPASSVRDLTVVLTDPLVIPLRRRLPPLHGALAGFGLAELLVLLGLHLLEVFFC
jgi:uncharacterized protein YggT (Ycf19 family)